MEKLKETIIRNKTLLTHLAVWAVLFLIPYVFAGSYSPENPGHGHSGSDFRNLNLVTNLFWIFLFYLNAQLLIPRLLYTKRYLPFLLLNLLGLALLLFMDKQLFQYFELPVPFTFKRALSHNISAFLFTAMGSVVYRLIIDRFKAEELQHENTRTELTFLRSQISPHFLFNVLNSMVALVRLRSEHLEDTIIKLSTLLHYMLYETDEDKVPLSKEVEYLQSYIDLQSMRFGQKIRIESAFETKNPEVQIAPMLLIPFVENAFKHGYGQIPQPEIFIELSSNDTELVFSVKNKYSSLEEQKDVTKGIGLTNVKRRLELLYPGRYELEVTQTEGFWFQVTLKINL